MILRFSFLLTVCPLLAPVVSGFGFVSPYSSTINNEKNVVLKTTAFVSSPSRSQKSNQFRLQMSDDFSNFAYMDDDDDLLFDKELDKRDYAKEEDSQELKAEVGSSLEPPEIDPEFDAEPMFLPQGSQLELNEENVLGVLAACREEIGTLFGYSAENRGVGITGGVDFVELDGPIVMLRLKGRFWHQRPTVLARVGAYLIGRIPEIIDVVIEDEYQLTDEANEAAL